MSAALKGKASDIKWIPVKNLSVVWLDAQRPLNKKHAQMIADAFDPEMFGALAVTKPNAKNIYHVIDGQHRKVAVESKYGPDEMVPCQVYDAEDPARAAELFDHINSNRRAPAPLDIFKIRVTAGGETQVAVDKIVKACGYRVGPLGSKSKGGTIPCVSALEYVYQSCGPEVLTATLVTLKAIWGIEDKSAVSAFLVRGLGVFLSEFRHCSAPKLIEAVGKRYTASRMLGAARAMKEARAVNMTVAVRDLLISAYNRDARGAKKLVLGEKN